MRELLQFLSLFQIRFLSLNAKQILLLPPYSQRRLDPLKKNMKIKNTFTILQKPKMFLLLVSLKLGPLLS